MVNSEASTGRRHPINAQLQRKMAGSSWHPDLGCPELGTLVLLHLPHHNFDGGQSVGQLIVAADVAEELLWAFAQLHQLRYPIERMQLICEYGGNDLASMKANNSSAFNCRAITGQSSRLSVHSCGRALDLNPVQNPYQTRSGVVLPENGRGFCRGPGERIAHPAALSEDSPVVQVFHQIGWDWGGRWLDPVDWQHFEKKAPDST